MSPYTAVSTLGVQFMLIARFPYGAAARGALLLLAATTLAAPAAFAQRTVPFQMGIPVAPQGLAHKPLADGPFDYATGEGQDIRVVVVTKALSSPFSMTWLPDGTMLVAQRNGELRAIKNGKLDPKPVSGGPKAYFAGESGLPGAVHGYMDVVLHPQYAQNQLLYLSYTKPVGDNRNHAAVARMKWTATGLTDVKDIWVGDDPTQGAVPIVFGKDGMLYIATSGGDAQAKDTYAGVRTRVRQLWTAPLRDATDFAMIRSGSMEPTNGGETDASWAHCLRSGRSHRCRAARRDCDRRSPRASLRR